MKSDKIWLWQVSYVFFRDVMCHTKINQHFKQCVQKIRFEDPWLKNETLQGNDKKG